MIAHALGEEIHMQPGILVGGDLKPYQMQVLPVPYLSFASVIQSA
jgi:hypothetical protein